jgi:GntR family transcriptional regulator, transcriptional repressor for pyruvate dehydrogenase complex
MPVKTESGRRVTDDAIDAIRARIASGSWAAGTRLPAERDLAQELGVSRNSLREAVCALSLAAILEVRQGDGTYVGRLEAGELLAPTRWATELIRGPTTLELLAVRRMLEPEAAARAAARTGPQLEQALRQALDRVDGGRAFHEAIAEASGNALLGLLLTSLTTRSMQCEDARDEHVRIYEPIVAGEADLARAAALVHVASIESRLRRQLADDASGAGAPPSPAG